ncbi:ATP-binding protein [Streptomyces sp. AM 2-1-1]|uniref:ATP-binding protein n=1 Tax=unclassified Streptomyces TaxID=2593676 RepID=UPI0023B8976B|nr:ATP-binding protein [Streptomyces sp. AM 2-1-1]WEH39872.1 ATP-binding protein [Streptomyces sp. AM 2-1-1]
MIGVIDTEGGCAEWSFPAEPGSVRGARNAVRETLRAWELGPTVIDLTVLLVSELVTNSLRHATGPIGVRLVRPGDPPAQAPDPPAQAPDPSADGHGLLVEVSDPLPELPTRRKAGPDDEGGRGLQLVACSARRWGTRKGKSGKTVWFELPLSG